MELGRRGKTVYGKEYELPTCHGFVVFSVN